MKIFTNISLLGTNIKIEVIAADISDKMDLPPPLPEGMNLPHFLRPPGMLNANNQNEDQRRDSIHAILFAMGGIGWEINDEDPHGYNFAEMGANLYELALRIVHNHADLTKNHHFQHMLQIQ